MTRPQRRSRGTDPEGVCPYHHSELRCGLRDSPRSGTVPALRPCAPAPRCRRRRSQCQSQVSGHLA
jgi:hypothetical protein